MLFGRRFLIYNVKNNYYFSNFNGTHPKIVKFKVESTDGAAILISFRFYFLKLIEFKMYTYCSPETQLHYLKIVYFFYVSKV
jgi:hypothetical protein